MPPDAIEAIGPDGTRLRLEFIWLSDRYGHCISRIDASGAIQPLLESIEGSPHDNWPPSPPLQSLTIEPRNGCPVALLLGMAGPTHWSASIEAAADNTAIHFDIACRHGTNPGSLGSAYRQFARSLELLDFRAVSANLLQQDGEVSIQPTATSFSSGTTRWRFTLSIR